MSSRPKVRYFSCAVPHSSGRSRPLLTLEPREAHLRRSCAASAEASETSPTPVAESASGSAASSARPSSCPSSCRDPLHDASEWADSPAGRQRHECPAGREGGWPAKRVGSCVSVRAAAVVPTPADYPAILSWEQAKGWSAYPLAHEEVRSGSCMLATYKGKRHGGEGSEFPIHRFWPLLFSPGNVKVRVS